MIENGGRKRPGGHRVTAFYIEALLLAALLTVMVLVLVWVFAWSGQRSADAALLTDAVHLAENGAEAVAASESIAEVRGLLEENGNAEILERNEEDSCTLRVYYDENLNPVPEGSIWMDIQWIPESSGEAGSGGYVKSIITVERTGRLEPVYTLETGVFLGGEVSHEAYTD